MRKVLVGKNVKDHSLEPVTVIRVKNWEGIPGGSPKLAGQANVLTKTIRLKGTAKLPTYRHEVYHIRHHGVFIEPDTSSSDWAMGKILGIEERGGPKYVSKEFEAERYSGRRSEGQFVMGVLLTLVRKYNYSPRESLKEVRSVILEGNYPSKFVRGYNTCIKNNLKHDSSLGALLIRPSDVR